MINIIIPQIYLRIIETLCKIIVFFGGRGGGKTEGIARLFLCVAYQFEGITLFCARETQDEFCATLMLVFKSIVRNDPQFQWLKEYCTFYRDRIEFYNGSTIFFIGLSEKTQDKIKGIKANFFWFDEAHALSKDTYELLVPSIREHNSKVVISFNTRYDYDFVSEEFLKNPAPNVEVIQVNAKDNPYLSQDLQNQMEADKVRLPYEEFLWKWEGGFKPESDTALFDLDVLRNEFYLKIDFKREDYTRIVIGIDPATTSKDYSNLSGLIVAGLNNAGEAVLIEDQSGLLKPNDLAKRCSELFHKYEAEAVVVEVNQGGDYIKSTLLGYDSSLRVIEVRAKQDKVKRMLPIANELYLGRIKALSEKVGLDIATQFRKFTNNGYLGAKGESPDRAEAFAWAVFELLGINEYATQGTIFKRDLLGADIGGITINSNLCFIYFEGSEYGAIVCDINDDGDYRLIFKHSLKGEVISLIEDLRDIPLSQVYANDVGFEEVLREIECRGIELYDNSTLPIEELALKTIPLLKSSVNVLECQNFSFNGINRNWLLFDLLNFDKTNKETFSPIVKAFCECMLKIKG